MRGCWFNKFHPDLEQCHSVGDWFDPEAQSTVVAAMRWCRVHKHDYDAQIIGEHACAYGIPAQESRDEKETR